MIQVATWVNLENITQKKPDTGGYILCFSFNELLKKGKFREAESR